jgi:hypothetical protein
MTLNIKTIVLVLECLIGMIVSCINFKLVRDESFVCDILQICEGRAFLSQMKLWMTKPSILCLRSSLQYFFFYDHLAEAICSKS